MKIRYLLVPIIIAVIFYLIGFSDGQASVYKKRHDDTSIMDIYMSK